MTKERLEELKEQVASIGHNLGPAFLEAEERVRTEVDKLVPTEPEPETELERAKIVLDLMSSHIRGEYLLPEPSAAYTAVGFLIIAAYTGVTIATVPAISVAGDVAILGFIYAALREEIEEYVQWRRKAEPDYAKHEA
ncbi:hypothetical protein [Actibacterium pelagium]|uniref:DUF1232 domain-containing protein n=1 Tax=Actibacterium pelagium TaxID=2029103 RepID=A0A917AHJ7_9RHOB|nr:hypothetical protein [Actibacterium pelagium]GGE53466.1 hypothetical protein GCM10011517_21490 [Actibacterium pelagium]